MIAFKNLTDKQVLKFKREGFLHLKNFFSSTFINYISTEIGNAINSPTDKYQSGFSRIAFDLFENDEKIEELMLSDKFRGIMKSLSGKNMLYTQGLGFELKKMESKGFPWHIGTQSFGYQKAEDFGCTIWTPLVKIDNSKQKGGMAYVPKDKISGAFLYENIDPSVFEMLKAKIDSEDKVSLDEFVQLRDGPLNDPAMKSILEHFAIQDDFQLGDTLIFDKHVIHRSVFLEDGDIDSRAAFVMRFVCSESKYDKKRAMDLEIPRSHFLYKGPTNFHLNVCENDGDLLRDSHLFENDIDTRLLA